MQIRTNIYGLKPTIENWKTFSHYKQRLRSESRTISRSNWSVEKVPLLRRGTREILTRTIYTFKESITGTEGLRVVWRKLWNISRKQLTSIRNMPWPILESQTRISYSQYVLHIPLLQHRRRLNNTR